jgi:uncharacterized YccA/Bax inhibitor family protein
MNYVWVGSIGGFIVALVTIYKKEWGPGLILVNNNA